MKKALFILLIAGLGIGINVQPAKAAEDSGISLYPQNIQDIYKNDVRVKCSGCHSADRALNARYTTTQEWKRVVRRMMRKPGSGINNKTAERIAKFLAYHSKHRNK